MLVVGRYSRPIFVYKIVCMFVHREVPRVIFIFILSIPLALSLYGSPSVYSVRTEHIQLLFIIAYIHLERVEKQTSTTVII